MRKTQKQEILEMIQTLYQAHDEVKNYIDKRNFMLAQDILSQCQECAITIGTAIENLEGEGFVTVSYVENYCDILASVYEELNGVDANANKVHKNLKKLLLRMENSVKNDIPIRKEIVFFPYKASMWDSLESVYLKAKEDPDCDVYCVPIPYYDRKPDRSLGQMHYEGREYPKNIEVIDWQTYNFEERKPDVIYIHNPYDDCNFVTSVHPRFYSSNLKKYTEKLVYIPYFVLDEIEPDDQPKIDSIKHFIWTPGVVWADNVIVQSEKMKQIYVNEYLKIAQENKLQGKHIDRKQLEEKFLGLGSPKFDKVKNTKKEDLEIPQEWLKIIEKPDGSWKKIVFYNTSVGALLQHNEKMLKKMECVFEVFKENKDEVALLWRPHPLIKTTVESMRPQLWVEYDKLVQTYRKEGWGIYDDTTDFDRAVVLSDVYYGDKSSAVQIYQKTGKTVMLQNLTIVDYKKDCSVQTELTDAIKINNLIWVCPAYFNKIIAMNLLTQEIVETYEIPVSQGHGSMGCFCSMEYDGKNIYLVPYQEKSIFCFNLETKEFQTIELDEEKVRDSSGTFISSRIYKNYIFMICAAKPTIVRLDTKDNSVEYINWGENKDELQENKEVLVGQQNAIYDNRIFIPIRNTPTILEFDCEKLVSKVHKLKKSQGGYNGICYSEGNMWLSPLNEGEIVKWNMMMGEEFGMDIPIVKEEKNTFIGIVNIDNRIELIPRMVEEKEVKKENVSVIQGGYDFIKEDEKQVIYYDYKHGFLRFYNKTSKEYEEIKIQISDRILEIDKVLNNGNLPLFENRNVNLTKMLQLS